MLKKRHNDFYLSTQSFMPVLDNLQLEINHLQNYVKNIQRYGMSSNIDVTIHYVLSSGLCRSNRCFRRWRHLAIISALLLRRFLS